MNECYLNVQYGTLTAEVNITRISRLGGVKSAIKAAYGEAIPVAAALIQLYTTNRDHLITDLDDINIRKTPQYYQEVGHGGCCVVINLYPLTLRLNHKMPKQFLNVQYSASKTRINVTEMEDLSEVQDAISRAFSLKVGYAFIQLYTSNRDLRISTWALFNSLSQEYFTKGGSCVDVGTSPPLTRETSKNEVYEAGYLSLLTAEENKAFPRKKQRLQINDLTTQLQSFANAQLVDECLQSVNDTFLPYPQNKIKKIFVRKCYEDVFGLLLGKIGRGMESFAISGTSGIGNSLFFIYILYRLMKDFSAKKLSLQPNRIVYQMESTYKCFDLQQNTVTIISTMDAAFYVREQDTFYIMD